MQYEVKIYGDISPEKGKNQYTLQDLQEALAGYGNEGSLLVRIKTNGGDVQEGFAIHNELRRFAKSKKVKISTRADGLVASIGTIIFLAGDSRILSPNIRPFVHNAYGDIRPEDLEDFNNEIAKFYSENTLMTIEEARVLMEKETFIAPEEALKMRFGTEIESIERPKFLMRFNNKENKMYNREPNKSRTFLEKVRALINGHQVNNKMIYDAGNESIDFYELADDEPITVGAKANYKDEPANGEIIGADGLTYIFTAGVLEEIIEPEGNTAGKDKEKKLEKKVEELEARLRQAQNNLSKKSEVLNKIINLQSQYTVEDPKEHRRYGVRGTVTTDLIQNIDQINL